MGDVDEDGDGGGLGDGLPNACLNIMLILLELILTPGFTAGLPGMILAWTERKAKKSKKKEWETLTFMIGVVGGVLYLARLLYVRACV